MRFFSIILGVVWTLGLALLGSASAPAKVFYAQDEAMEIAFPEADEVETLTFIMDESERTSAEKLARTKIESKLFTFYKGIEDGKTLGYAAIESNIVRSLPETFLVVLTPEGRVKKTVMLAFHEPLDYLPSERWLEQFNNQALSADLWPQRGIAGIVGSTLSVRAVTLGVRKVLALYAVLIKGGS